MVGDANIFTSAASAWCVAVQATNGNSASGILEGYAAQGSGQTGGLSVYIGTDTWFTDGRSDFNTTLFTNAINQAWNPSGLPCKSSVTGVLNPTPTATPTASVAAVAVPATGSEDIRSSGSLLAVILVVAGVATLIPAAMLRGWVMRRRRNRH